MLKNECLNHTSHYTLPNSLKGIEKLDPGGVDEFFNLFDSHESKITSLRYTPNGRYLWSVEEKGIHKAWDAQSHYQCLAKGTCLAKW